MRPPSLLSGRNPRNNLKATPATIDKAIHVSSLGLDPHAALRERSREAKPKSEGASREKQDSLHEATILPQ
jgi:hypothetical protein